MIIISYNKQTWNEYDDSQTADENLANGAIISADRLNNMETGISNNDTNKVTDNKDGTEQINNVKVSPFNKLTDTVGGVNYIKDGNFLKFAPNWGFQGAPDIAEIISDDTSGKNYYHWRPKSDALYIGPIQTIQQAFSQGDQLTLTLIAHADQATNMSIFIHEQDASGNIVASYGLNVAHSGNYSHDVNLTATDSLITWHWTIKSDCNSLWLQFSNYQGLTNDYYITNVQLEKGSIATDWTPAPEDKVNVSDMRKPASDVAGIEEVNAKQDKIGYTPADDSKVAHLSGANNFDTVPTYGTNNKPLAINDTGATTARPTGQAVGYQYFDTTLNKPIWYNGSDWVDSTGTTV